MSTSEVVERQAEHLRRWQRGESPPPLKLTIGTTYVCNLRCRFCEQRFASPESNQAKARRELPAERLLQLVREAGEMGVQTLSVSGGGEPFLRPHTLKVMRAIKEHGMSGGTTTNGLHLSSEHLAELVRIGWGRIDFSIDGPDSPTHDYLRDCPGAFERVTRAVKELSAYKRAARAHSPFIGVTSVLTNRNHDRIPEMVELAARLGAQVFTLTPLVVHHEEGEWLKLKKKDWNLFLSSLGKAQRVASSHCLETNLWDFSSPEFVRDANDRRNHLLREGGEDGKGAGCQPQAGRGGVDFSNAACYEPWTTLVVHPDGYVNPCERGAKVTHIGERSLAEVWREDRHLLAMREKFLRGELPQDCAKCCGPLVSATLELRARMRGER